MKLSEIHRAGKSTKMETFIDNWDDLQPSEGAIDPFKVHLKFQVTDEGSSHHPYGDTTAEEDHGISVEIISAHAAEEVKLKDEDDKVLKTWPKGTELTKLPGWKNTMWRYLEDQAYESAQDQR